MRALVALGWALTGCQGGGELPVARLPTSTSIAEIPASEALVSIDASDLHLDGDTLGSVDAMARGPAVSMALEAQLRARATAIASEAARNPAAPTFKGAYGIEIDRDLPAEVLLSVVQTASSAGFGKPWIVVADADGARHGIQVTLPEVAAGQVAAAEAAGDIAVGGYANPTVTLWPERGYIVTASDRVVDPGAGLVIPCASSPCGADWPTIELNRLARRIKLDHGKDRAAIVAPGPGTTVQDVVTTFDALRDDTFAGRGTQELFPQALLSRVSP